MKYLLILLLLAGCTADPKEDIKTRQDEIMTEIRLLKAVADKHPLPENASQEYQDTSTYVRLATKAALLKREYDSLQLILE